MTETLIGYARCSTDAQDLTAQRDRLRELGVPEERTYLDHGLTGTSRKRPGLDQALAAVREGDTLVAPKLDRLARSVPDARAIGDGLAARGIKLSLGGQVYDPHDPMGKMFFNILATFAEFEVDLLRMRTREGMAVARAKGASCAVNSRNCLPGSNVNWPGWPAPANTPSPTSPKCSPSPAPPSTAPSNETSPPSHADSQSTDQELPHHIRPIFSSTTATPVPAELPLDPKRLVRRRWCWCSRRAGLGAVPGLPRPWRDLRLRSARAS